MSESTGLRLVTGRDAAPGRQPSATSVSATSTPPRACSRTPGRCITTRRSRHLDDEARPAARRRPRTSRRRRARRTWSRTSAKPKPGPRRSHARLGVDVPRENRSKTASRSSGGTPGPASHTDSRTASPTRSTDHLPDAATVHGRRSARGWRSPGPCAGCRRAPGCRRVAPAASGRPRARAPRGRRGRRPAVIAASNGSWSRARSSRSSSSSANRATSTTSRSTASCATAGSSARRDSSTEALAVIVVSGLRSSWLTSAANCGVAPDPRRQSLGHRVERARDGGQVGVGRRRRPRLEVAARQPGRRLRDVVERTQHAARRPPAERGSEQGGEQRSGDAGPDDRLQRGVEVLQLGDLVVLVAVAAAARRPRPPASRPRGSSCTLGCPASVAATSSCRQVVAGPARWRCWPTPSGATRTASAPEPSRIAPSALGGVGALAVSRLSTNRPLITACRLAARSRWSTR